MSLWLVEYTQRTQPLRLVIVVVVVSMVGCRACHGPPFLILVPAACVSCRRLRPVERRRPAAISALLAPGRSVLAAASHVVYCASFTTRMAIGMKAWSLPQSSEHCP